MTGDRAKRLVQRYYDEVLTGGRVDVLDELLAPSFVSHGPSDATVDRAGYIAAVQAIHIHRLDGERFIEHWEQIDLAGLLAQLAQA